jgi:hypothetical protein
MLIEFTRPPAVQRSAPSLENRTEYGAIARDLLGTISHRILKIFLQHINLVAHLLTRKLPTDTAQDICHLSSSVTLSRGRSAICAAHCNSVHVTGYTQRLVSRSTKSGQ